VHQQSTSFVRHGGVSPIRFECDGPSVWPVGDLWPCERQNGKDRDNGIAFCKQLIPDDLQVEGVIAMESSLGQGWTQPRECDDRGQVEHRTGREELDERVESTERVAGGYRLRRMERCPDRAGGHLDSAWRRRHHAIKCSVEFTRFSSVNT